MVIFKEKHFLHVSEFSYFTMLGMEVTYIMFPKAHTTNVWGKIKIHPHWRGGGGAGQDESGGYPNIRGGKYLNNPDTYHNQTLQSV